MSNRSNAQRKPQQGGSPPVTTPTPVVNPNVVQQPANAGGNRAAMQAQMFDKIDELGEIEGKGGNSRATLGVLCVEWAFQGAADVGDAGPIYDRYIQKAEGVAAVFGGLKPKKDPEQGRKQNVSKMRQFLKMGGLKTIDPIKVIHQAAGVVKDARAKGTIGYSPFDSLLNIARKQCASTQAELTAEEMISCNQPKVAGDVAEADALGAIAGKIEKFEKTFGVQDETTEALEQINARIEALGGTTAQKKQKELAKKKADKEAAKLAAKK